MTNHVAAGCFLRRMERVRDTQAVMCLLACFPRLSLANPGKAIINANSVIPRQFSFI